MAKTTISVPCGSVDRLVGLLGVYDENLELITRELDVKARVGNDSVELEGEEENAALAAKVINKLLDVIASGEPVDKARAMYMIELAKEGNEEGIEKIMSGTIAVTSRGKPIKCKTFGQKKYVEAIRKNPVVFGVGPAGTGKTYLAVALASAALKSHEAEKIILTRPAVEAGEKLGFLPGDLQTKVDPYLRPLYDALQEMFGLETYTKLIERGSIEIAPLAYMRGRTLSDAFIILDEAQNTTREQMKMFLTRMGENSKMIITGDVTQTDLPAGKKSGLVHATEVLEGVEGIATVKLTHKDVVRHPLVMEIIKAYDRAAEKEKKEARPTVFYHKK